MASYLKVITWRLKNRLLRSWYVHLFAWKRTSFCQLIILCKQRRSALDISLSKEHCRPQLPPPGAIVKSEFKCTGQPVWGSFRTRDALKWPENYPGLTRIDNIPSYSHHRTHIPFSLLYSLYHVFTLQIFFFYYWAMVNPQRCHYANGTLSPPT